MIESEMTVGRIELPATIHVSSVEHKPYDCDIVHEISKALSFSLAKTIDEIIRTAIDRAIGIGWALESLSGRMDCVHRNGDPWRTYRLDGQPILRVRDQTFDEAVGIDAKHTLNAGFEYQYMAAIKDIS